jgi:hypothetical protein
MRTITGLQGRHLQLSHWAMHRTVSLPLAVTTAASAPRCSRRHALPFRRMYRYHLLPQRTLSNLRDRYLQLQHWTVHRTVSPPRPVTIAALLLSTTRHYARSRMQSSLRSLRPVRLCEHCAVHRTVSVHPAVSQEPLRPLTLSRAPKWLGCRSASRPWVARAPKFRCSHPQSASGRLGGPRQPSTDSPVSGRNLLAT